MIGYSFIEKKAVRGQEICKQYANNSVCHDVTSGSDIKPCIEIDKTKGSWHIDISRLIRLFIWAGVQLENVRFDPHLFKTLGIEHTTNLKCSMTTIL